MATQITLPRLSPGMNEAAVARWLKKAGDQVKAGEALFEVETEKVATEVPSPADGVLTILVPEGQTVAIGTPLAVLGEPGEQVPTPGAALAAAAAPAPAPVTAAPVAAPGAVARTVPLQGMRRTIAERMLQSQNTSATVTVTLEVDMDDATRLRQQLVGEWEQREGVRITFTDLIVKAVAKALTEQPRLNATLRGSEIVEQSEVHVGVAVALEDGLIVPVVRNADRKPLLEIGRETKDLGERARTGRL